MNNLFNFEYVEQELLNADGTKSNFRQIFGRDGINMACPKESYHIVKTEDVSRLGHVFINKGYNVNVFDHRNGEKIGLNIQFGNRPSSVGESNYSLILTIPNNGGGKGYLSVKQHRLICSNGMMSNKTMHKDNYIKIPHTIDYNESLRMMEASINGFLSIVEAIEMNDEKLNGVELTESEAMYQLNKWFYECEMPTNERTTMTLDEFRKTLALEPKSLKCYARYKQLTEAFKKELGYNKELELNLSMYTVYASVTNYLSRRIEKSKSKASDEVKFERASNKLAMFDILD